MTCGKKHGEFCFYCDMPLGRHEHDHFPIPKAAGGKSVVPCCVNCHDLKDRVTLEHWPLESQMEAWRGMPAIARIYVAKAYRVFSEKA